MFNSTTYISRREKLINQLDSGVAVFPANEEASKNFPDNWYPYRQDSSFLYFCGLNTPGMVLVVDIDAGESLLFANEITMDDVIWSGPQPRVADRAASVGIKSVRPLGQLQDFLQNAEGQNRPIHKLPSYRGEHTLFWGNMGLNTQPNDSISLIKAVVEQREIKTPEELQELHKASSVTASMHLAAMRGAREGMKEYEVKALVVAAAHSGGGDLSFPPIITKNGHILHNHYYGNTLEKDDILLIDTGAELMNGYAGDRTSVVPVNAVFSPIQKEVYDLVHASYVKAVEMMRPGVLYRDVHLAACTVLAEGLTDLGIMKGNTNDAVANGAHALFMPHGLGHMMGLDVHDMEDLGEDYVGYDSTISRSPQFGLKSLRMGKALEEGHVLTVEPGCYFIPELIERWKAEGTASDYINYSKLESFYSFGGIRIEDDYVVTENGTDMLGDSLPRTSDEINELRREALQ